MITIVTTQLLFVLCLLVATFSIREPTIKQVIAFLIMVSGILGALLTFFLTLPPSETVLMLIGSITVVIALIAAFIKMLREMQKAVDREVTIRENTTRVD